MFITSLPASAESLRDRCSRASCWPAAAIGVLSVFTSTAAISNARADEDDDDAAPAVAERTFVLSEQQFDQMMFGGQQVQVDNLGRAVAVAVEQGATNARKRMDSALATEIELVDRTCSLTDAQKKKLRLAGRGDIHQFFSRVSELRPKLTSAPLNQQEYVKLMAELQPLRMTPQSTTFSESSLFHKTLRRVLTDEQRIRYRAFEREQQVKMVESVLMNWDRAANGVKLSADNRRKFVDVLVEHGHLPPARCPYIHYIVLLEAGRLEEQLKPLLTEENWGKLQTQITQARSVEPQLRRMGHLPRLADDDDEDDAPAAIRNDEQLRP